MKIIFIAANLLLAIFSAISASANTTQAAPYKTVQFYNLARQVVATINPDPDGSGPLNYQATRSTYNAQGLVSKAESGELASWPSSNQAPSSWASFTVLSSVSYTYDKWGKKTSQIAKNEFDAIRSIEQFSYDSFGRLQCRMVRMATHLASNACYPALTNGEYDRITHYTYDNQNNILAVRKAYRTPEEQIYQRYEYSANYPVEVYDANSNRTSMRYDGFGRLEYQYYPHKTSTGTTNAADYTKLSYDASNNIKSERKRSGTYIDYTYDKLNRITLKNLPGSADDVYYQYTPAGLEVSAKFTSHTGKGIGNSYNGFGELTSTTTTMGSSAKTLNYSYDSNGNRTYIQHADGNRFYYGYDELNRPISLQDPNGDQLLSISYQRNGSRNQIKRTGGGNTTTDYHVDGLGRLNGIGHNFSGSTSDIDFSYNYNQARQVNSLQLSNNKYHYTDGNYQAGNYVVNGLNQYTTVAGKTLGHDSNANMTADGEKTYSYDAENRLKSVSGNATASFVYDPKGRLHNVTTNGVAREFLYDGDALVAEYTASGTMLQRYIHGDQVDEPWVQYASSSVSSSNREFLHSNHQGSIVATSTNTGYTKNIFAYDAFGIAAENNVERFGYTGQVYLKALGLYYYKARFYHPKLGRFLQTDPIGYDDNMNLYAYTGNDPVNKIDPSGMCDSGIRPMSITGGGGGGRTAYNESCQSKVLLGGEGSSAQKAQGPGSIFDTTNDAAADGILYASERPQFDKNGLFLEQGGDVYPVEGGYTYNDLQVGEPGSVKVRIRNDAVGWFHTHPPGGVGGRNVDRDNRYWSRGDRNHNADLSAALGRPLTAYIGGTDGAVRSFTNDGARKGVEVRAPGFFGWKR